MSQALPVIPRVDDHFGKSRFSVFRRMPSGAQMEDDLVDAADFETA
jgi:hypothetical protein